MRYKAKHIPNTLGILRVIACVALIPLMIWTPYTWYMMAIYMFAGFTDMIDGSLARRIKDAKSEFGATLDSVADMILVVITIVLLTPAMVSGVFGDAVLVASPIVWDWMYWAFLGSLGFKLLSGVMGRIKHGEMVYLHTYSVKLLGFILFIIPILYYFIFIVGGVTSNVVALIYNIYMCFAIFYIWLITTEEIIINFRLKEPCRDIKSIWGIKKANERPAGVGYSEKNKKAAAIKAATKPESKAEAKPVEAAKASTKAEEKEEPKKEEKVAPAKPTTKSTTSEAKTAAKLAAKKTASTKPVAKKK